MLKNLTKRILLIGALIMAACESLGAPDIALSPIPAAGGLSYQQDGSEFSIRFNQKEIYRSKDTARGNVLGSKSSQNVSFTLVGLENAGNCCPWYHLMIIENDLEKAKVYDTKINVYLNDTPTIALVEDGFVVTVGAVVNEPEGAAQLILKNGKITRVKPSGRSSKAEFCKELYGIYKMECSSRPSVSCDDAALLRFAEIDSLAKKSSYSTDGFFDACYVACKTDRLNDLEAFSTGVCVSK